MGIKIKRYEPHNGIFTQCYLIRVTVGAGSPVLEVPLPLLGALPGYPDAAAPVGDARAEVVDAGGLVGPGQPALVILALVRVVRLDVADVVPGQLVYRSLNIAAGVSMVNINSVKTCPFLDLFLPFI